MAPTYVIGHRNPDTDSIAAAIAYAELKSRLGVPAVAARAGALNPETTYVLERFGFEQPRLMDDLRLRAVDILRRDVPALPVGATPAEAWRAMRGTRIRTLPLLAGDGTLAGLVTQGDLGGHFLDRLAEDRGWQQEWNSPLGQFTAAADVVSFQSDDLISEVRRRMIETRYRAYPVLAPDGTYAGLISRYELLAAKPPEVILVDHNERSQAAQGLSDARVVEIIDHHRLGGWQTNEPILIRAEPVGSTCTIVATAYAENGIEPTPQMAGLLAAGILSDTVVGKSPTTTERDRALARQLASRAGVDAHQLGLDIFTAGSDLAGRDPLAVLREDWKDFELPGGKVGIGQIETLGLPLTDAQAEGLLDAMEIARTSGGYRIVLLMVTDIIREGTDLLYAGPRTLIERAFDVTARDGRVFLPGVMSRKKQVIPPLARVLAGFSEL
ncbi:MAG: putative manganese-dependent inorganic diphosphatase [Chloroflexota bacterium]